MTETANRAVVVCARFQPPHRGHLDAIAQAAASGARVLVVMLGAEESRSLRNPWSDAERRAMITSGLPPGTEVDIIGVRDRRYDRLRWTRKIEEAVRRKLGPWATVTLQADLETRSDLPPWPAAWLTDARAARFVERENLLRALLFWGDTRHAQDSVATHLIPSARGSMQVFVAGEDFAALRAEAAFIRAGKARWAGAPYPPIFVTVDALVCWGVEVLLIERGRLPGAGLLALPGGFLDPQENLLAACRRELLEETGVDAGALAPLTMEVFDDPYRSLRGRTITHLFQFVFDAAAPRPLAVGGDDARHALWTPRTALRPQTLFEDHYAMLQCMLNLD